MKKTFKFLTLTVLLSMVGAVSALAQAIKGTTQWSDDVQYKVTAIRVVSGDVKEATVSVVDNATPKSGVTEVTIPGKVTLKVSGKTDNGLTINAMDVEFSVTKIDKFGYANKNDVKKFNIPAEVEEIGADAFHNAASQTNTDLQIVFATGSKLKKIGDYAFGNCAAKTIDLSNCNDLDLTGSKPFVNRGTGENNQLQKVILPEGIQNIGQAFAGLPKLTELDLSNTKVTTLEDGALANTGLTEVTIPAVTEATVQTVKIGSKAFENSPIEKLTINAPIATQGAIASDAFYGMPKLKEVNFNGDLLVAGAVPENAFKDSPLEKVKFNKVATGAISAKAFENQDKLNSVAFNDDVEAGAIGESAFAGIATKAGECATVVFRKNLLGEAAIGTKAFDGAAIKILFFKGNLANKAISTLAFNEITCDAAVRFEGTLGAQAIGEKAFNKAELQYVLFALAIDQEKAIDEYAFNEATIIGSDKFAVRFGGALNAQHSIGTRAFYQTDIQKDIIFAGDIAGKEAISGGAFSGFNNSLGGGVPVLFSGNISGERAIGEYAFQGGAVSTVTINGNVSGLNAISDCAFLYCGNNTASADAVYTMTSLVIKGEVSNTNAIGYQAFAGNLNLALIDLQGNIYAATAPAIAHEAFAYVGKNSGKLVVNFGPIKSSQAIFGAEAPAPSSSSMPADPAPVADRGFGAFYGAVIDVVNFDKLMAEKAVADFQFGGATINTVNFNAEFKKWPEAQNNAAENFVGWNAFTGTKVKTVNFNAPISVEYAIYAAPKAERKATSFNATYAAQSPFAENGAPMTINFNADVVENGIGAYAFSNSNTVAINLASGADFGMRAFRNWSFYGITWDGTAEKHVDINYDAPTGVTDRSFAQGAFYGSTDIVDIYFNTTKEVLALYTAENNASDLTPFRIKGIATKYIDVTPGPDGNYYGVFTPENEMYVIEKYQESGAQVGVWSAYADDLTLEATGDQFTANGRDKYKADLYINPLRVQDKGKYVLNAGHTLIVTSSTADKVIATQDLGTHKDGGVQTFAGLSPWACNDLRWNPAESNGNNWGGYVNWAAIDNGDKDVYGNVVRDYELFRQYDFASQGLGFGNSINIPEDQMYILVASLGANQIANRIKYSEYDNNAEWFEKNGISWEKSVAELIADAVAAAQAAESGATEKYNDLIKKLQEAAADESGNPSTTTDEDALIEEVMQKIIDEHLSENAELKQNIMTLADELLPLVKNYAKALCDLRNAKEAVERTNRIPAAAAEELEIDGTFSDNLDNLNGIKEAAEDEIAELDEYLTVAAGDEQGDDMYKKYLALKAVAGGDSEAKALLAEYDALPDNVKSVIANNQRTTNDIKALGTDKDAVYYPFRNKYVAWSNQTANNSFTFNYDALSEAATHEATDDELDAVMPDIASNNIDLPSTFKADVEEAAEEAEAEAQLFKDWEDANKAIEDNKDVHAQAAFDNILWTKRNHYTLTQWTSDSQYAEEKETIDVVAPKNDRNYPDGIEIGSSWYRVLPFVVVEGDQTFSTEEVYGVIEGAYGADQASIVKAKKLVRWNSNNNNWEDINGDFVTLVTTSDVKDYLPMAAYKANANINNNAFEALLPHTSKQNCNDLYDQRINILDVDATALNEESQRCYDLLTSMKGLIDNGYVLPEEFNNDKYLYGGPWQNPTTIQNELTYYALPDLTGLEDVAEDVKEDAETAREIADNWVVAWYAQANEVEGSSTSMDVTYNKEMEKLAAQALIAEADAQLAILMAIEDPYDGESACQKYLDAVEALGTPAVEDDETTTEVDETVAATGAYLAVDEAKEAKDEKVQELKDVVNGIEDGAEPSPARLNIIWNDGNANVTGIMEAVVSRAAENKAGSNAIYNLNGMRVKNAQKGVFIQNGKKVIK